MHSSFGSLSVSETVDKLETSPQGLSSTKARQRLEKYGLNTISDKNKSSILKLFIKQFRSSLVYLLIVAAVISLLLKDINDALIIIAILFLNTILSFFQEYKADHAMEKLQKLVSKEVEVKRDGQEVLVNEKYIAVGDLVVLREGDVVPADIRLIKVDGFSVNESQLSGESEPINKKISGNECVVFAGSTVESGEAEGLVFAIAKNTQLGKIASLSQSTKKITQYESFLSSFSSFLIRVTFLTLAVVFILKVVTNHSGLSIAELGLFIIALSITVVPEVMPVIASITLATGASRLAKKHVIAKTLTSVEDLGNINILCSDKTGTLTENKLEVEKLISDEPKIFQKLAIASLESFHSKKKFRSSFDEAFLRYIPKEVQDEVKVHKLEELPFDPAARRRRVVVEENNKTYLIVVGSVETLLELTHDPKKTSYLELIKADGKKGMRHLGIAYKEVVYKSNFSIEENEHNLKLAGFVAMSDPIRRSTQNTLKLASKIGVAVKILSGDSREVTQYVGMQVGLVNSDQKVFTGDEIEELNDNELIKVAEENNVFVRLNPEQKYRIINALKSHKNVVGYQGDGINDAPALKLADVAIAVSGATDVARESADIVLLRNDLEVVIGGISYGRTIFGNINKYIKYTMIGNFGNFFALTTLFLLASVSLPLTAIQLLLNALLGDIPLITIATDNVEVDELMRPSKYNPHGLMFISLFLGSVTAIFEVIFYMLVRTQPLAQAQSALFLYITLSGFVVIFSVRNKHHFWKATRLSNSLMFALILFGLISIGLVYTTITQKLFALHSLSLSMFSLTIATTIIYLYVLDIVKVWYYKTKFGVSI